jgi:hypothetical protein
MTVTQYFRNFIRFAQSSGNLLVICVILSLLIANSNLGEGFKNLLDFKIGTYSISLWINDGLMTIFFLLVGLEIKRELIEGELSSIKSASLPILAAIGGIGASHRVIRAAAASRSVPACEGIAGLCQASAIRRQGQINAIGLGLIAGRGARGGAVTVVGNCVGINGPLGVEGRTGVAGVGAARCVIRAAAASRSIPAHKRVAGLR